MLKFQIENLKIERGIAVVTTIFLVAVLHSEIENIISVGFSLFPIFKSYMVRTIITVVQTRYDTPLLILRFRSRPARTTNVECNSESTRTPLH